LPRSLLPIWAGSALVFLASWLAIHHGSYAAAQIIDTPVYQGYGDQIVQGKLPYRDFGVEYPPGALPIFALPALGHSGPTDPGVRDDFRERFEILMVFCALLALAAVAWTLRAVGASTERTVVALGAVALAPLLLGSMIYSRFDYWPAAVTAVAVALMASGRRRWAAVALGVAIAIKVYPAALVPLLLIDAWKRRGRGEALRCAGLVVGAALVLYVPFLVASPHGVWDSVHRQTGRPLQIETLGSALLIAAHHLVGVGVSVSSGFGSQNLASHYSGIAATLTTVAELAALLLVWVGFARSQDESADELLRFVAAAIVAFVAFGKVLSPQYMVWLVPAVAIVGGRRGFRAGALTAAALGLTLFWFPGRYWEFIKLGAGLGTVVLLRDLVLVAVLAVLLWPERHAVASAERPAPAPA
jgi:uncharacterized membrane protein